MTTLFTRAAHWRARLWRTLGGLALLAAMALPAQAGPTLLPYAGSGNAVLFDAGTGEGGWVGALDAVTDPAHPMPLSLVSVVLFRFDAARGTLSGRFEFTDSQDLGSALFGTLAGSTADADPFGPGAGGQLAIDYAIEGGRGRFAGVGGFGLAFLDIDPSAAGDNYAESGLLVLRVPVPGSLGLVLAGLLVLAMRRRAAGPSFAHFAR